MLEEKTRCKSCGHPVLVRTVEATEGYCMRCFRLPPEDREDARRTRGPATLAAVEEAMRATLRVHVLNVRQLLGAEAIYGFALFTDPFYEAITSCVFTEAALLRVARRYQETSDAAVGASLEEVASRLRWNPADSPYLCFRETEDFHTLNLRLGDFWRGDDQGNDAAVMGLEAICTHALKELRVSALVPSSTALLLVQDDQSFEERFALAELLNPPEVLERLRNEWQPDPVLLEYYRKRFSHHHDQSTDEA